jgi:hypothetical protein
VSRFIILYLVVTGIGTAIVLAAPWLVIIGFALLIVPGLILSLLPSAFGYGLVFALCWFPLQALIGKRIAAAAALAATFTLFWVLPMQGNAATQARYLAEGATDHLPAAPIALAGDIRMESDALFSEQDREPVDRPVPANIAPRADGTARTRCSALCAALLFTPGVTSVTMTSRRVDARTPQPLSPDALTFRLVPHADCKAPIQPWFGFDQFGEGKLRALEDDWKLRLSTRDCIVAEAPMAKADIVLLATRFVTPLPPTTKVREKPFEVRRVDVTRLEIFDRAGRSLLRSTQARAKRLIQPLFVAPEGGLSDFHFDFASTPFGKRYAEFDPMALLATHTTLQTRPDPKVADAVRVRLGELLDDRSIPASDPGFGLVGRFLKAMADDGAPAADVVLLVRLIGDDRVVDFNGLWAPARMLGPRLEELRAPAVARLRRADPATQRPLRTLGGVLGGLPPGAFATFKPGEAELLADYDRHVFARFLIERQGDRGAAGLATLTTILDGQLRRLAAMNHRSSGYDPAEQGRRESALHAVDGVQVALCRMGPAAAAALPVIATLEREGLFGRRSEERDWQLTLARLGRPVESIPKPANLSGTDENFHRNLHARLDRFRVERDCRASWI